MKRLAMDMVTAFWQSKPPIYLGRARRESLHAQAPHRAGDGLASGHRVNLLERYDYPVLAQLYGLIRRGELDRKAAERQLDHLRGLRLRLLGDRVLQSLAWKIADQLGWPDTFVAEYIALTQLQADAFVCTDTALARAIGNTVTVASIDDLLGSA
jgi:predicted nucleic acid-binding protein